MISYFAFIRFTQTELIFEETQCSKRISERFAEIIDDSKKSSRNFHGMHMSISSIFTSMSSVLLRRFNRQHKNNHGLEGEWCFFSFLKVTWFFPTNIFFQHKCKYMHTIIIVFFIKRIVNRQLGSLKISFRENTNLRRFLEHIHPNFRIKLRDNRCISAKPVQTSCMYLSNSQ